MSQESLLTKRPRSQEEDASLFTQGVSITFGDRAENGPGMEQLGTMASKGFSFDELKEVQNMFEKKGAQCEIIHLNKSLPTPLPETKEKPEDAYVLVIQEQIGSL